MDQLPSTLGMLDRGQITYMHAKRLTEAVVPFDAKTTAKIEDRALVRAADQTVGQFSASVRRAVIAADPRLAEQRHEDALAQRCVVITPEPDGMAELCALLPAEGATLIKTVLDSLASTKTPGETRTTDQRRADALVEVFARVLGDPSLPEQHGHRPAHGLADDLGGAKLFTREVDFEPARGTQPGMTSWDAFTVGHLGVGDLAAEQVV